jgi:ABC transporter substrate binding protein (PQQ-dependent alcohol dehydrogenase system)
MKRPKPAACNAPADRSGPRPPGRREMALALASLLAAPRLLAPARADGAGAASSDDAPVADIPLFYLRWMERHPTISRLDAPTPNAGLAGAEIALDDNNTTGRFLNQHFTLTDVKLRAGDDPAAAVRALAAQQAAFVLSDLPAAALLAAADAGRALGMTFFNIASPDDALRGAECRADIINVAPSRAMLADALAQYLVWKKWSRWFLVSGSHPDDAALADAYRRAAKRFGARIVAERVFKDTGESRQSDSGIVLTQQLMPTFTQGVPEYDVLVAADESEVFADDLPYRTWDARPVVGSAGLRPVTWDAASESWGGAQLQDRFVRRFHRNMMPLDMQAWTAVRMVGEAASRAGALDAKSIVAYLKGPDFAVAAYKGEKLTLRPWDWQLRQPILLADGRTVVSVSPQKGFLHQVTELDTLGIDRPETTCKFR